MRFFRLLVLFYSFSLVLTLSAFSAENNLKVLRQAYTLAMTGGNKQIRFASVIVDSATQQIVIRGSWNRLSETNERRMYCADRLNAMMPQNMRDILESAERTGSTHRPPRGFTGSLSLDVSVHAEQAAIIELLQGRLSRKDLDRYKIFTIGVDNNGYIGVALKREWTCFRCALWLNIFPLQVFELFSDGFEKFLPQKDILTTALKNTGYWGTFTRDEPHENFYEFVPPETLASISTTRLNLGHLQSNILALAIDAAKRSKLGWKRSMGFGSVLVSFEGSEPRIISTGWTKGPSLSSEEDAIKKAKDAVTSLRNLHLYTVGIGRTGMVALVENPETTYFRLNRLQKLGLHVFELSEQGFIEASSANINDAWLVAGSDSSRPNNPFFYKWIDPDALRASQ